VDQGLLIPLAGTWYSSVTYSHSALSTLILVSCSFISVPFNRRLVLSLHYPASYFSFVAACSYLYIYIWPKYFLKCYIMTKSILGSRFGLKIPTLEQKLFSQSDVTYRCVVG
jgi:hypothetical protein